MNRGSLDSVKNQIRSNKHELYVISIQEMDGIFFKYTSSKKIYL